MEIKIKEPKSWQREIEVTVESERVKKKIEDVTASYAQKVQIAGFRKGKVPRPILQKRYGTSFEAIAIDELFDEIYKEIINAHDLKPITQAKISDYLLSDDKTLKFDLSFEVIPNFEMKNYIGLKLKKQEPVGFDQEFERRIKTIQEKCATFITANRPAEIGDFILVDYEIYENETLVAKKQSGIMLQLGSERNHPNINQALLGCAAGEEKSVNLIFGTDHPEEILRGKTLTYKFYIRDIKIRQLPEIDDKLASNLGFKDLDDMRAQINEEILQERTRIIEEDLKNQIYRYLVADYDFEPPQSLVDYAYQDILSQYHLPDNEENRSKLLPLAIDKAKFDIILSRIAEKENITVTPEEIENEVQKYAQMGVSEEQLKNLRFSSKFISAIQQEKTLDFLLQKAEIS
ncbi:MAG: trigger factor [candidate division WOR-3 bacterium]|nr:trigger factor [candidate division WOR-3 bacterium]